MRQPRTEKVSGSQRSELGMVMGDLPIDRRKRPQPLDGPCAFPRKTMKRFLQVTRIESALDNRSLGIDVWPLPRGIFQQRPEPQAKVIHFFFRKMVDDFDNGPLVRREFPRRLHTPDKTQLALKNRDVRFQSVDYPRWIHCHGFATSRENSLQRGQRDRDWTCYL